MMHFNEYVRFIVRLGDCLGEYLLNSLFMSWNLKILWSGSCVSDFCYVIESVYVANKVWMDVLNWVFANIVFEVTKFYL